MLKTRLVDPITGKDLHTYPDPSGHPTFVTTDYGRLHGTFASTVWTAATATTTVVAANSNEGIVLTDLILSCEKVNAGSVTVNYNDADTNAVTIMAADINDAPVNLAIPFQGNWAGWQGCFIEVIVVGLNCNGSLALGYYRTPEENTLSYAAWNTLR